MSNNQMTIYLKIWRQEHKNAKGKMEDYKLENISPEISFLEMLDILNQKLILLGTDPVTFDHDCREGICGACGLMINGIPHGFDDLTTTCQLHMRRFKDGDTIVVEPFRAKAFTVLKDLMVDRSSLDDINAAGGFVDINTGCASDANAILIPKENADTALDASSCIGCGACIASCKNASAMLFVSAKVSHLASLPQGKPEALKRVTRMVSKMDELCFGNCTNEAECEATCPKGVSISHIAKMNREYLKSAIKGKD